MNTRKFKEHSFINLVQTILLIASMAGLLGILGWTFAGYGGAKFVLIFAVILFFFAPRMPAFLIMKTYRGQYIDPGAIPQLHHMTRILSEKAGLKKMPTLYYIPSHRLNAFAAGTKEDAAIGITHGLLHALDSRQMAGILGHEISHIKNNDMQVMWIANLFSRMTRYGSIVGQVLIIISLPLLWVSEMAMPIFALLLLAFSPAISYLLNLALSRTREFKADMGSAHLTENPHFLASALQALEYYKKNNWRHFFISGAIQPANDMFSTHPKTEERIRRLLDLSSDNYPLTPKRQLMFF